MKSFHDRDGYIWMDGELKPWREANLHFLTHALHYGTCVFEGERAYSGKIFKSEEHSRRLLNSADIIHMDMHWSVDQVEQAKQEVLEANKLENAYIRAAAWFGSEQMGIDTSKCVTHLAVAAWDWGAYFGKEQLERGISLTRSRWHRPAPNTAPIHAKASSLYNLGCMAKNEAKKAGFDDALMLDFEGYVAESSGSNFFAIQGGTLVTPIADRFLNGITRRTVMDLAVQMDIPVDECRIKPEDLSNFQEIFVTGTAAELTPVSKIDDLSFTVGPVTKKLQEAYSNLVNR